MEKGGIQELPGMDHRERPHPGGELPNAPPSGSPVDPFKGSGPGNPPGFVTPGPGGMGQPPSHQTNTSQPPGHVPSSPPIPPGHQIFPGPTGSSPISGKIPGQQFLPQQTPPGPVTQQFQPQSWTCPNCQSSVDSKFAFCMSCGHNRHQ